MLVTGKFNRLALYLQKCRLRNFSHNEIYILKKGIIFLEYVCFLGHFHVCMELHLANC